jgi:hypothetical protein
MQLITTKVDHVNIWETTDLDKGVHRHSDVYVRGQKKSYYSILDFSPYSQGKKKSTSWSWSLLKPQQVENYQVNV